MSSVTVKTLQQKIFKIDIEHTETVRVLKEKIEAEKGDEFPADMLKLIYAGKILDDAQPLTKYKIQPNGFVVVMVRKSRAPPPKPAATQEASATATATSGETSTATQETSTPVTTETSQPATESTTESTTTESGDATRMETSEATPTAQGTDTTDSRGGEALQQAGSTLATGEVLDEAISNLMALGYERDVVVRALNAAFNNPDRAAEMLISGEVPEAPPSVQERVEQEPGEQPSQDTPPPQAAGQGQGNRFDFLRNTPQFETLRQMVQQNPGALPSVLQHIAQSNPQLIQLIGQNRQEFIDILNEPASSGAGESAPSPSSDSSGGAGAPPPAPGGLPPGMQGAQVLQQQPGMISIQVTPEEKEAIERLKALGFTEGEVLQAYFACEKNEELAANFLFTNQDQ